MNYKQAIDTLTSQGRFHINLGLERVQKILDLLKNPEKKMKFIHVAGTNGKGSVCAMLSAILSCTDINQPTINSSNLSPLRVGLFTSPHVFEYTERIKINDIEINRKIFAEKIFKITELAKKNTIHLTEFEILTAVAFEYFAENNVDIVILETGLGGRLDATNVIEKNICSIITNIDFDHTERLGGTIEKIAFEKAGIIKKNCPVIVSSNNKGFETIKKVATEKKSQISAPVKIFQNEYELSLVGIYQKENLAFVLKAVEVLNQNGFDISKETIESGLKNVKHPCRFEFFEDENILIDGAHNPDGVKKLRESINNYFPDKKIKFIFGCLNNKNYPEMINNLFTSKDEIYFFKFNNPNACTYEELNAACHFASKPFKDYKYDKNILTVICGSFYMIKELKQILGLFISLK